jgi:hypothetical protein
MENPFRPGAGHQPPYLAGRVEEKAVFEELLKQRVILKNLIITGLRGIGKTVLLEELKPTAITHGWRWTGTDCSESASVNEDSMAVRLITDLALITSDIPVSQTEIREIGFGASSAVETTFLNYELLISHYNAVPGLPSDKLKSVLEVVWKFAQDRTEGIIFAYDEAQTLGDHAKEYQFPLSLLLDVFQSLQKKGIPFMLILTGLPTLLSNLVETRTYSERLFRVLVLEKLNEEESRDAILKPISPDQLVFSDASVKQIIAASGGYPYFIQFFCKEVYDIWLQQVSRGEAPAVPIQTIIQKLDNDFFAGRWERATDREKDLMRIVAEYCANEFRVQDIVEASKNGNQKFFSPSHVNQMLRRLIDHGLVYKNRRGSYSFAVPLLETYIRREMKTT